MDTRTDETEQSTEHIQELEEFRYFAESLSSHHTVYDTLNFLAKWCARLTHADRASVLFFTPVPAQSVRIIPRSLDAQDGGFDQRINTMAAGWVRTNKKALLTDNLLCELPFDSPSDRPNQFGPLLSVPLFNGDTMIGVLNLIKFLRRPHFTNEDLQLMNNTALFAARYIERARILEDLTLDDARLRASTADLQDQRWIPSVNPQMQEITDRIARVAPSEATVLITGETGTGKELVARAIHLQSRRAQKTFVVVDCGAIPASLADAELFGHERGAFTGVESLKPGKFELADGGTLFFDEISAMPLELQSRLLRVLEEKRFNRLGSSHAVNVDARVIASTNKDLEDQVKHGAFREDLFHRLNVFPIRLPPLRGRREDIPILASAFLAEFTGQKCTFAPEALSTLEGMSWPGNVRELRNLVERVSILSTSVEITRNDLVRAAVGNPQEATGDFKTVIKQVVADKPEAVNLLEETEKQLIEVALQQAGGNITKAAQLLGIGRISLHRRLEKFHISNRM